MVNSFWIIKRTSNSFPGTDVLFESNMTIQNTEFYFLISRVGKSKLRKPHQSCALDTAKEMWCLDAHSPNRALPPSTDTVQRKTSGVSQPHVCWVEQSRFFHKGLERLLLLSSAIAVGEVTTQNTKKKPQTQPTKKKR